MGNIHAGAHLLVKAIMLLIACDADHLHPFVFDLDTLVDRGPHAADELPKLLKALGTMFTHKVDYADLYFQFTKSEGWSLEEGIVKTGSFSIDQGVGSVDAGGTRQVCPSSTTRTCPVCGSRPYW